MSNPTLLRSLQHTREFFEGKDITKQAIDAEIETLLRPEQDREIGFLVMRASERWDGSTPYTEIGSTVRDIIAECAPEKAAEIVAFDRLEDVKEGYLLVDLANDLSTMKDGRLRRVQVRNRKLMDVYPADSESFPLIGFPVEL